MERKIDAIEWSTMICIDSGFLFLFLLLLSFFFKKRSEEERKPGRRKWTEKRDGNRFRKLFPHFLPSFLSFFSSYFSLFFLAFLFILSLSPFSLSFFSLLFSLFHSFLPSFVKHLKYVYPSICIEEGKYCTFASSSFSPLSFHLHLFLLRIKSFSCEKKVISDKKSIS